jgi:hypothetical protein
MDINYIIITSGSHPEKMDLKTAYPNFYNANKAVNMILSNCLKTFNHGFTEISVIFEDGNTAKVSFRTCEGLNGRYFVADLLDELIELLEGKVERSFFGLEEPYKRLKAIQDEWEQHYDDLYESSYEPPSHLEDMSFLMQINPYRSE